MELQGIGFSAILICVVVGLVWAWFKAEDEDDDYFNGGMFV